MASVLTKYNMKIIFVLLLVTLPTHSRHQQCLTINDFKIPHNYFILRLYDHEYISLDLLQAINQLKPHENVLFSPYSIHNALMTTYLLSGGETENQLSKLFRVMGYKWSKILVYNAYKEQTKKTSKNAYYEFININKIYVSDRIAVRDCIQRYLPREVIKTPFATHPELVRSAINKWADNFTYHMIEDLLPPGTIDSSTNLLLVNAASLRTVWETKFNPKETKQEIFYVNSSKQIMVDMMYVESRFRHYVAEDLDAHFLELPYKGYISMGILLPRSTNDDAIDRILDKWTLRDFTSIRDYFNQKTVRLSLPKFTLEHTIDLQPILESLGVGNLFESDADFSKLFNDARNISIDAAIHKATIVTDENGVRDGIPYSKSWGRDHPIVDINCNRPFVFFIFKKDELSRVTVLFVGIYRKPDSLQ